MDKLLMFRGKLSRSQVGASQFSSAKILTCRAKAAATHRATSIGRRHCLVTALQLLKYAELPQSLHFFCFPQVMINSLKSLRSTTRLFTSLPHRFSRQAGPRHYSTKDPKPTTGQPDQLRFFPILAIFILGSGSYVFLVKKRAAEKQEAISGATRKSGRYQRNA